MRVFQAGEQLFNLNPGGSPGTELRRTIVHRARGAAWEQPAAWPDSPNNCSTYSSCCLEQIPIHLVPGPLPRTIARVLPRSPGSPEARTRTICPGPQAQHAKKARAAARAPIPRTIPRARGQQAPPPRENGVICPIMVLFIIFCYLSHII